MKRTAPVLRLATALAFVAGCAVDHPPAPSDPVPTALGPRLQDPQHVAPSPEPGLGSLAPVTPANPDVESEPDLPTSPLPAPENACPEGEPPDGWFADVSSCAGMQHPHVVAWEEWWASGQAWADVDGDGRLDLVLTSHDGQNGLYLQQPDGRLENDRHAGVGGIAAGGATFVDADGDGDPDLFLNAWGPDQLLWNDHGDFSPAEDGPDADGLGMSSAWADLDGDGHLEVYTANYFCPVCSWLPDDLVSLSGDRFHDASADGWADRTDLLGPELLTGAAFQASFADFDDDGDLDLYVANDKGSPEPLGEGQPMNRNVLFRNDGPGCGGTCFEEVGIETGADLRVNGMCVAVGDYDNDLDLDIAVTDSNQLYLLQNLGGGQFVDASVAAGIADDPLDDWGCVFFDYDNDGWLDLFAAGGFAYDDRLLHNQGDGTFADASVGSGLVAPGHSLGAAAADYDRDGLVDLVLARRDEGYELMRNLGATGSWLGLRLVGSGVGGTDAVGARVYVEDSSGRVQMREVKIGSSLGAGNDLGLHFGLGEADVTSVTVVWPDGLTQTVAAPQNAWSVAIRSP